MRVVVGLAVVLGGCFTPPSGYTVCDNDAICPSGLACTETPSLCAIPGDVSVCIGMPDRTGCSGTTYPIGSCKDNVCDACNPNWVECRYPAWTAMASGVTTAVHAVHAFAADNVYAVTDGALLKYDGTSWQIVPDILPMSPLVGVWGSDPGNLFLIDNSGHVYRNSTGLAEAITPGGERLSAIWGTSSSDVITVGAAERIGEFDGTSWDWGSSGTGFNIYSDVWGADGSIFAIGQGTIQKRTGSTWMPMMPPNAGDFLNGIWGTNSTDFFVVGRGTAGVVHRYAGTWQTMSVPPGLPTLRGVWGSSGSDVYAVGSVGTLLHYDGTVWTTMPAPDSTVDVEQVTGVGRDLFAVGQKGAIWKLRSP